MALQNRPQFILIDSRETSDPELQRYFGMLSQDEQQHAKKYQHPLSQTLFILTRGKLREWLGGALNLMPDQVALSTHPHGKPYLSAPLEHSLYFNISHSHHHGIIALSKTSEIGVDIEVQRSMPNALELAKRFFHPDEVSHLAALSNTQRSIDFLKLWTYKEACLKASGEGIATHLGSFSALPLLTHTAHTGAVLWRNITCYSLDTPSELYGAWAQV